MRKILILKMMFLLALPGAQAGDCTPVPTTKFVMSSVSLSPKFPLSGTSPIVLNDRIYWKGNSGVTMTGLDLSIKTVIDQSRDVITTPLIFMGSRFCFGTLLGFVKCHTADGRVTTSSKFGDRIYDLGVLGSDLVANVKVDKRTIFVKATESGAGQKEIAEGLTLQSSPGIIEVGSSVVIATDQKVMTLNLRGKIEHFNWEENDSTVATYRKNNSEVFVLSKNGVMRKFSANSMQEYLIPTSNIFRVDMLNKESELIVVKSSLGLDLVDTSKMKSVMKLNLQDPHSGISANLGDGKIAVSEADKNVHILNVKSKAEEVFDVGSLYDHVLGNSKQLLVVIGPQIVMYDIKSKKKLDLVNLPLSMAADPFRMSDNTWYINSGNSVIVRLSIETKNEPPAGCPPRGATGEKASMPKKKLDYVPVYSKGLRLFDSGSKGKPPRTPAQ